MRTIPERTTAALTTTEAAVLGVLAAGPGSGYDLRKRIESSVGYFWGPAKTQIYAVLPRLVESGLATRRDVPQHARPDKHVYRVTRAGRDALREWVEAPGAGDESTLLLKVFFGSVASADAVLAHVGERRAWAEQLRTELLELDARAGDDDGDLFPSLTRTWGHAYAAAAIAWADEAARAIRRGAR